MLPPLGNRLGVHDARSDRSCHPKNLIDPALRRAGWDLDDPSQVGIEIPVDGFDPAAWRALQGRMKEQGVAYNVRLPAGISDYTLHRPNGDIIAIVEAKRTIVDPRLAEAQAEFYVTAGS